MFAGRLASGWRAPALAMSPKKKPRLAEEYDPTVLDDEAEDAEEKDEELEEEEMKSEVKDEKVDLASTEKEEDAPADGRQKLGQPVVFHMSETTPNLVPSTVGSMLVSVKEGALQYLFAGARCSVGVKSGRYAFEVKIVETLSPAEAKMEPRLSVPKSLLRIGLSTAGSSLILGDGQDNVCFDESGSFMHNNVRSRSAVSSQTPVMSADSSIVLVLNLDLKSPNFNTISLFKDGVRLCLPQELPDTLKGKVLFPTVTFKNVTVHTNFSAEPEVPLPFRCRMIADAAMEDVVATESQGAAKAEVIFPVCLPDEGTFDWLDWFLSEHPSKYTELSDRAVSSWATRSGLVRKSQQPGRNSSNDKPDMGFNVASLDDTKQVNETLISLANVQRRSCVVMEVKGNLMETDRRLALKKWRYSPFKKVAQVMIGTPEESYKKWIHALMLAEKQEKANKEFERQKAEKAKKKSVALKTKQVEKAKRKAEKARQRLEELAALKAELQATAEANGEEFDESAVKLDEDVKDEESEEEKEEMEEEEPPPVVALTPKERQVVFRKQETKDISPVVLSTVFQKFSLPSESEGFDEVRYVWSSADETAEFLRRWVVERKTTTRIEDLQPSDWFRDKWQEWQNDLKNWHLKHVEFKDPSRKAAAGGGSMSKATGAPPQMPLGASAKAAPKNPLLGGPVLGGPPKDSSAEEKPAEEEKSAAEKPAVEDEMKDEAVREEDKDKDPMQLLEEEMDREDVDIFGVEDVCDVEGCEGTSMPLFSNFAFEDWALLSLRFELHLLVHAFRHDAEDPERTGIPAEHLAFYYNKYYKKMLNPKNYGVDTVDDLVELVKDTVPMEKLIESMVSDDLESNDIFIKLTEEARRDRQRRLDAGDDAAALKFSRPTAPGSAISASAPSTEGGTGGPPTPKPAPTALSPGMVKSAPFTKAGGAVKPGLLGGGGGGAGKGQSSPGWGSGKDGPPFGGKSKGKGMPLAARAAAMNQVMGKASGGWSKGGLLEAFGAAWRSWTGKG